MVIYKALAGVGKSPQQPQGFQSSPAKLVVIAPRPIYRGNYTLVISEPAVTKSGKTARNRKYSVQFPGGSWSLKSFCMSHEIGLPAMIARLRPWPSGKYEQTFMDIYKSMKHNRTVGKYEGAGRKHVCPHCGEEFTKLACIHARRRKQRDASPVDHALRTMPAEFFGEVTLSDNSVPPTIATPEAEPEVE